MKVFSFAVSASLVLATFDADEDGVLSGEGEIMGSVSAWFEMMDSSGDGQVDSSDFGKKK